MRDALHGDSPKILTGEHRPLGVQATLCLVPSPSRYHLYVKQLRRDDPFTVEALADRISLCAVISQGLNQRAGIDNNQRESRSARTAATAASRPMLPPALPPARCSTSSSVSVRACSQSI